MKTTINTVKNHSTLTVILRGKKYFFISQDALIDSLVKKYKKRIKLWATSQEMLFEKITTGDGRSINPYEIYLKAYHILCNEKYKNVKLSKKTNRNTYIKEKGYLFDMKDRDTIDSDECKGKKVVERGFYFYEEPTLRKVEKNWKSFRKTQYKHID